MAVQAPPTDEGIYGLVDLDLNAPAKAPEGAAGAPEKAPEPIPAPPTPAKESKSRLLGFLRRKDKPAVAVAEAATVAADGEDVKTKETEKVEKPAPAGGVKLRVRKKKRGWKYAAPAWVVSGLVHLGMLGGLGLVAISADHVAKVVSIDSAPFDTKTAGDQAEELVHILAPVSASPRDQAVGDVAATTPGAGNGLGTGTGSPSKTPRVGASAVVSEGRSLPQTNLGVAASGMSQLPSTPMKDFGLGVGGGSASGGGGISGTVTMGTKDIGEALDQLAREILRHLAAHKLTVVWLFDESGSMKDDQKSIHEKFGRVSSELKLNLEDDKKTAGALNHVVVGFGESLHTEVGKPTTDIDLIGKAIDRLSVDMSGTERTCEAVTRVVNEYSKLISKERRLLVVLVTDESGDDGQNVEEARQALVSRGVPLYIIGRQALFGYDTAHLLYIDPVTKDHYWPAIKRGPESAAPECLQVDGLHDRRDEQPSGFAPYELARLAKDSGGIYFLLPSEENMRVKQREKAYSIKDLKEYVPNYENRADYFAKREKSELRRLLVDIIQFTSKDFTQRIDYSIVPEECIKEMLEEGPKARIRLEKWMEIEKRLKAAQKLRDREPDKRWQAHYDLMLAQVLTYQVKCYEYLACLDEMIALMKKNQLQPKKMPIPGQLEVWWHIDHSHDRKAPKVETEKKYAEAKMLLEQVIKRHPKTPWADLAQDEFNRGFGCQRYEWSHSPEYGKRAALVPKY